MDSQFYASIFIAIYLISTLAMSIFFVVGLIKHKKFRTRFSGVVDAQQEEDSIREKTRQLFETQKKQALEKKAKISQLQNMYSQKLDRLRELENAITPLEDLADEIDVGFFEPKFQLEDHAAYVFAIKKIREEQKQLSRLKKSVVCDRDWTVGDSRAEGRKMVNRATRLTLRAFNNECDVLLTKVNWKNIGQIKDRMIRSAEALNKLNESLELEITHQFLRLKLKEAELVNEEKLKKEEEKDRLRAQREQEREEAKAQREIQAEMKRQEKYEREKQDALRKLKEQISTASDEHRAALEAEAVQMEEELAESVLKKGRLLSMAEQTRIGHLYVISNTGAFGERLVKIGMTRRIEPLDRVKELGDASVPFPFDVHAMVFSEDAPKLEKELHAVFDEFRTNKINRRKEFFELPLAKVHAELEHRIPGVPFAFEAPSMEFIASQKEQIVSSNSVPKDSERFSDTI